MISNELTISAIRSGIAEQEDADSHNRNTLRTLLSGDLNFHDERSQPSAHGFHSFPAKFPPKLPRTFIDSLTLAGEIVLDPMMGSGTTVLEAYLSGRKGIGFDVDPLAILLSKAKLTTLDTAEVDQFSRRIIDEARSSCANRQEILLSALQAKWDLKTLQFVNYWFLKDVQVQLLALSNEIEKIPDNALRTFFQVALSGTIITKTGGVSLALDLAHTRPHRAKILSTESGPVLLDRRNHVNQNRLRFVTKTIRSAFDEFRKKVDQNAHTLTLNGTGYHQARIEVGSADRLPLDDESIDLVVTSPPYASNAIDYMRAHKFSLVWLGYSIEQLGEHRKKYFGNEKVADNPFEELPNHTMKIVESIRRLDPRKGLVLQRYYSDMMLVIKESRRVLRPGKSAIFVVGNSIIRGINIGIQDCFAEMGRSIGLEVVHIGIRNLDRNKRMMPASSRPDLSSQIQQRMHEEFVIGYYKPRS